MNNPRLAGRYAKSLLGLAVEQNQLDAVHADMRTIRAICKSNPDFVAMLKSPVINADKKEKLLEAITTGKVSAITTLFLKLLVSKARENSLPEIAKAFIDQYNERNNIHQVKVTTAVPMSDQLRDAIVEKIKTNTSIQKIELETAVDDDLIGGFTLELGDTLVDASILRDLNDVKKQFKSNEYIHSIR